jgi:hypothetical protein
LRFSSLKADISTVEAVASVQSATINPIVAQAIALATHANLFLRERSTEPLELVGSHSSFRTTFEVTFDRVGPGSRPFPLADGTAPWYRRLQKEGVNRMWLVIYPWESEKAARVAGIPDPRWGLVTEGDVGMEMWAPDWTIRPGINPKQEAAPWRVSWQAEKCGRTVLKGDDPFDRIASDLEEAVAGLAAIVRATGDTLEKATYDSLLAAIQSRKQTITLGQFPDLFEEQAYEPKARWLGMNSVLAIGLYISAGWKDRRFESPTLQKAFDQSCARYWRCALAGIQAATNSLAQ